MKTKILITFGLFFFMINVTVQAQYACGSAIDITSIPYDANNLATSDANYFAAWAACDDEVEEEAIYIFRYVPTIDEKLMINVTSNANREAIIAFENCSQPLQDCLTYEEGSGGGTNTNLIVTAGEEYFIAVVTDENASFNISITKEEVQGVAINKSAPTQALDVNGAIRIGEGTTTPYEGTVRWNSTIKALESFDGTIWEEIKTRSLNDLIDAKYNESSNSLSIPTLANLGNNNVIYGSNVGVGNGFINGYSNSLFGSNAGRSVTSGSLNVILGSSAGANASSTSIGNVFIGHSAGSNDNGTSLPNNGNIFIGFRAGYGFETSNKLVIDNNDLLGSTNFSPPLIYGDFEDNYLLLNRSTRIGDFEVFGVSGSGSRNFIYIDGQEPGYAFSFGGVPLGQIFHSFNSDLRFEYKGLNGDYKIVKFTNQGEVFQSGVEAMKSTAGEWMGNSDQRLKKNIAALNSSEMLDKVRQMKGVEYEWNDNTTEFNRPKGKQTGFIAQDLQRIFPEKIKEDEDGFLLAAYGTYDPVIIEAIKALADKAERQEQTIEKLTQKLAELERLVKSGATASKNQSTN